MEESKSQSGLCEIRKAAVVVVILGGQGCYASVFRDLTSRTKGRGSSVMRRSPAPEQIQDRTQEISQKSYFQ